MRLRSPHDALAGAASPLATPRCCRGCWCSRSRSWSIPVTLQIFSRYTALIPSYIWTEEMARFLFIWMIMIGAMIGVREGTHFEVDVWPRLTPRGGGAAAAGRPASASSSFALVFVWSGIEFTRFAWYRISELAELPLWLIHIAWPLDRRRPGSSSSASRCVDDLA